VDIYNPTPVVFFRDPSGLQISSELTNQIPRHAKNLISGFGVTASYTPCSEVICEVTSYWQYLGLAVLGILGSNGCPALLPVEIQIVPCQLRQFSLSEPGQNHGLVLQRPLMAASIQPLTVFSLEMGLDSAFPLALGDRTGSDQWPLSGGKNQALQFVFGQSPPFAANILLHSDHGDDGQWIRGKPK
jgi:hypothetical protein